MQSVNRKIAFVLFLLMLGATGIFNSAQARPAAQMKMEMPASRVDKVSRSDFQTTLAKLEKTVKANGFMVVAKINHQKMLSMVGTKMKGAATLEFGKPDMMKNMLPMNPAIGLEMPLKIYVFENQDGKTVVSYHKPSAAFGAYGMAEMAGMMDNMLAMITDEATK